jgi:3-oxoacyl-(acyl-carrier-protein) synthase
MKRNRVVVTGMGVVSPNATGLDNFEKALRNGKSGIRFIPRLEELKFSCQIGGVPKNFDRPGRTILAANSHLVKTITSDMHLWQRLRHGRMQG